MRYLLIYLSLFLIILALSAQEAWQKLPGPPGGVVRSMATSKNGDGRMALGTIDGRVYYSFSGGEAWVRSPRIFNTSVEGLVYNHDGGLWAAVYDLGTWVSRDNGKVWQEERFVADEDDWSIEADDHLNIYVGTAHSPEEVFRSADQGSSWARILRNQIGEVDDIYFSNINRLFVSGASGLYYSDNRGNSWYSVGEMIDKHSAIRVRGADSIFYALTENVGTFISKNSGKNWKETDSTDALRNSFANDMVVLNDSTVFIATDFRGLLKSQDYSYTFSEIPWPAEDGCFSNLLLDSSNILYLTTCGGAVWRSLDDGHSWHEWSAGIFNSQINGMAIDASGAIYAAVWRAGVYKSENGSGWLSMSNGISTADIHSILVTQSGDLFVGIARPDLLQVPIQRGLFKWNTDSLRWTKWGEFGDAPVLDIKEDVEGTLYCRLSTRELFRSSDNAQTWTKISGSNAVSSFESDDQGTLFMGTENGLVFRSNNKGDSWEEITTGLAQNHRITSIEASDDGMLYCSLAGGGVYRSFNKGDVWQEANAGLTEDAILKVSSTPQLELIAAGYAEGEFWLSDDLGNNWTYIGDQLARLEYASIAYDRQGYIYLGTNEGIWKSTDTLLTALGNLQNTLPTRPTLGANYPNPFNPLTSIPFELPRPGHIKLEIFDAAGRHITTLLDEQRPAGRHLAVFDGRRLSSGVYFYRLSAQSYSQTRKMLLVK